MVNNNNNNKNNNNNTNDDDDDNNNNHIERCNSRFLTIFESLSPTGMIKWPRHNCVQITCNMSSAYQVMLRAMWYEGMVSDRTGWPGVRIL